MCMAGKKARRIGAAVENSKNIGVAFGKLINELEFTVNALNEILHGGVEFLFSIGLFEIDAFPMDEKCAFGDGFFDIGFGTRLQIARFSLPRMDNCLSGFRQLGNVFRAGIFIDLLGLLEFFIIWVSIGKNDDDFVVGLRFENQLLIAGFVKIACYGYNSQTNGAAGAAMQSIVDVFIVIKAVFSEAESLCGINIFKHGVGDAFVDLGHVYGCVANFVGDVLFFIREESIGIAAAGDVILAEQAL